MSKHGQREAWAITAACLIVAGLAVASSVSPSLEAVLNVWLGVPVAVIGGGALLWVLARAAWDWWLIEWEIRRPIQPDELSDREEV